MALSQKQNDFINTVASAAQTDMEKSNILASITIAQAILESGWGQSELAKKAYNLFGIKANNAWKGSTYTVISNEERNGKLIPQKSKFRKYTSHAQSIEDHSDYLRTRSLDGETKLYRKVVGEKDYKVAAKELQKAGYSTYSTYAEQLINIIERYDLDQYDKSKTTNKTNVVNEVRIFLDAGHGGKDSGAVSGKRHESDDVLKLVLRIGKLLETNYSNVKVGYSRKTDIYESVSKKAKDSNEFGADYFFSFHRNSYNGKAEGFETEYKSHSPLKDSIMSDIGNEMKELGFVRRTDKKRGDLGVLNQTKAPALLFEVGFIDNPSDNKIFDKQFDKIVDAFVRVIVRRCKLIKKTGITNTVPTTVKKSSPKADIKWMQRKLNQLYVGTQPDLIVDGLWGSKTTKMLKGYWKQLGWSTAGTYCGIKTCKALSNGRKR